MVIHHKAIISNDLIILLDSDVYEPKIAEIINLSKKVFPEEYFYKEKQPNGECDYIGLTSNKKYDAKLPFESKQVKLLTDGKRHSPQIVEWLKQLYSEASDFNPLKLREDPNYSVASTKLYNIMKEQLDKDKPDENIIFFIPFPIVMYSENGTSFLNQTSNYLTCIYDTLKSEKKLLEREIYAILPSFTKNIWALVDLEKRTVEFIEYNGFEKFISYEAIWKIDGSVTIIATLPIFIYLRPNIHQVRA